MKKSIASIILNWIGGGKTPIPVRFLKSIDIPGEASVNNNTNDGLDINYPGSTTISADTKQQFLQALNITEQQLNDIFNNKIKFINIVRDDTISTYFISYVYRDISTTPNNINVYYGATDYDSNTSVLVFIQNENNTYSMTIQN